MIPPGILEREHLLRRAVAERQFTRLEALIASYCELANEHLSTFAPGDPAKADVLRNVIGVFEWSSLMISLARSGYADQLTRIQLAGRYRTPCPVARGAVHVDG